MKLLSLGQIYETSNLTQNNDDLHLASEQRQYMNVSRKKLQIDGVID